MYRAFGAQYWIEVFDPDDVARLMATGAGDYPRDVAIVEVRARVDPTLRIISATLLLGRDASIKFKFRFEPVLWTGLWPMIDYVDMFGRLLSEHHLWWQQTDDVLPHTYVLTFRLKEWPEKLGDAIETRLGTLREIDEIARRNLFAVARPGSFLLEFEFPAAISSACQQYLIFFSEFMRDVGVDIRTEIIEEAERILFAVTPKDPREGLERIRQALDVYLQMPNAIVPYSSGADIAIAKLAANIRHLQAQLELARAVISTQNATIDAQLRTIDAQETTIASRLVYDSLSDNRREEVIADVLSVKPVEAYGVELDLPAIVRRLRRLFRRR